MTYDFNFTVKSFLDTNHHHDVNDAQQWKHLFLICRSISFFIPESDREFLYVDARLEFFCWMFALKHQIIMIFFFSSFCLFVSNRFISCGRVRPNIWFDFVTNRSFFFFFFGCYLLLSFILFLLFIDSNLVISNKIHIKLLSTHFSSP